MVPLHFARAFFFLLLKLNHLLNVNFCIHNSYDIVIICTYVCMLRVGINSL